ncbi:StsB family radical SAM/SPASM domain sactipeptide maturase [Actinospica robiniae]|uniref:StsB family radical SAM/SPASM domain sactipeptide maturase n=1 Tax=Actinospica robiniae TaxID=304901 RepID=UPI00068436FB|nr:StsB family radical SAM/SPASM domain sactipeptide maturase [Actinospica robiniae]
MGRKLVSSRHLFEVPADLTYFTHGEDRLVVNPEAGARCLLGPREFRVLQALAGVEQDGEPLPIEDTEENERALAKLILSWVVYYNGHRATIGFSEPELFYAYYAITDGCNLRCPYCYASSEKCLPGELDTAESMRLVEQLAELGTNTVVFTGGEPMLRKDLFRIVEHAKSCGLNCNIITNATMIRTQAQARRFAELFYNVVVSVDGATAESHDRTRGKGSFAKTHKALKLLNAEGVRPNINHIVTSDNVEELEDFAVFMEDLDVQSIRLMNHDQLGRGVSDEYDFGWRDHLRVQKIVWTSPVTGKIQADGPRPLSPCSVKANCGMGGNEIYINSLGDVYPCKLVTDQTAYAGNVRERPLREIFEGPVLRGMRMSTVSFAGEYHADCSRCYIKASCGGGCRATHMSDSGSLKRNSRTQCRILRHGVTSQLWLEAGYTRAQLAEAHLEMTVPRMVATGEVHAVHDDWQTYVPNPPAPAAPSRAEVGKLLPLTPVRRSTQGVPAGQ